MALTGPPGPEPSLPKVIAQAAAGDQEAWRTLVQAYSHRVFGLLARQSGDRDLAQELTQETFVRLVTQLDKYNEQGQFEPWLFRIAMNLLRDEMRRRKRQARTLDEETQPWSAIEDTAGSPDPSQPMRASEEIQRLRQAVARLSEAEKRVLHLRHTAGLSFAQIAQALDEPLGTVLARGHRALAKLRKMLDDESQA